MHQIFSTYTEPVNEPEEHIDLDYLKVKMSDVAKLAGVSRATVSRVLSKPELVTASTRDTVHTAARQLGYIPNVNAQMLASKRSSELGLLLRAPDNPIYGQLFHCLQQASAKANFGLLSAAPSSGTEQEESEALSRLVGTRPAGLLIATGTIAIETVKPTTRLIPTVFLPRPIADKSINAVSFDEKLNAQSIAEAVFRHGHRDICVISRPPAASPVEIIRTTHMTATLRKMGARVVTLTISGDGGERSEPKWGEVAIPAHCTTVMFPNDKQAAQYIAFLRSIGETPGESISVTGMDGVSPWAGALGLATVRVPIETVAENAIKLMTQLLEAPSQKVQHLIFPGELQLGSTLANI